MKPYVFQSMDSTVLKSKCILDLSSGITTLLKKNGEPCNVQDGKPSRKNIETYATVAVSRHARNNWGSFSVVVRELTQSVSDAWILVTENNSDGYHWSTQETTDGFSFYLNKKLAAECILGIENDGAVSIIFYNRGGVMPIEAFQVGSNKLPNKSSIHQMAKQQYIAGGHGIGLKDIISSSFSILKMNELSVSTYHPNHGFRSFQMNEYTTVGDKRMPGYSGVYALEVRDKLSFVPPVCKSLMTSLENSKDRTPGTVLVLKKEIGTGKSDSRLRQLDFIYFKEKLMTACQKHLFFLPERKIQHY